MSATASTTKLSRTPRPRQSAPGIDPIDAAIDTACTELRLPSIRDRFADIAEQALRDRANYKGFLLDLLRAEIADRDERRRQRLVRHAAFHRPKRLEDFDYDKNPQVDAVYVNNLANPAWVRAGAPLVLVGNSGTGKSHLLIGIGTAIAEHGLKVRYTTTANLVNELAEAHNEKRLSKTIYRYSRYDHLAVQPQARPALPRRIWISQPRPHRRETAVPDLHRTRGTQSHRRRLQRPLLRMGQNLHRGTPLLRHRRPAHLQRLPR